MSNVLAKQFKQELTDVLRQAVVSYSTSMRGAQIVREITTFTSPTVIVLQAKFEGENGPRYFEILVKEKY